MYAWIDGQRRLNEAWLAWATPGSGAAPDRMTGLLPTPGGDWLMHFALPPAAPPPFGIDAVMKGDVRMPVEEIVVDTQPFCTLRLFRVSCDPATGQRAGADRAAPSVLLCAPLAGHHVVILREMIQTLLPTCDVYITDWTDARDVPLAAGRFGLDDDVHLLERYLRLLGDADVHVVAICQACAPALAATALHVDAGGRAPLSLALLGGPIDTRANPSQIDRFAQDHSMAWLRAHLIDTVPPPYAGAGRRVLPGYIQQLSLLAVDPQRQLELEALRWQALLAGGPRGYAQAQRELDAYSAVLDMDETYVLETAEVIFKENRLAAGSWQVAQRLVPLAAVTPIPILTIEGELDRITGAMQTHAALDLCAGAPGTPRRRVTIPGCDHYGLFVGAHWRGEVYPALTDFWRDASQR